MTSRHPGACARCGQPIPAGTRVDWDRATRLIRHLDGTCQEPAETSSVVLPGRWPRPRIGQAVMTPAGARIVTALRWMAREEAEDLDEFAIADAGGAWIATTRPPATDEERAACAEREAREREAREREEATRRQRRERWAEADRRTAESAAEWDRRFPDLTAGLVSAGYRWSTAVLLPRADGKTVLRRARFSYDPFQDRITDQGERWLDATTSAVTGAPAYIERFGNAAVLWADPATVEAAWEAAWQRDVEERGLAAAGLYHLAFHHRYGDAVAGAELSRHVVTRHGAAIVAALRAASPIPVPRGDWSTKTIVSVAEQHGFAVVLVKELPYREQDELRQQLGLAGFPRLYREDEGNLYRSDRTGIVPLGAVPAPPDARTTPAS